MSFIKGIAPKTLHDKFGIYTGSWSSEMDRCWEDFERGYSVTSRMIETKFGNVEHVSIVKHQNSGSLIATGGERPIGWNEKMMIKNELFGENRVAIEVYPKQEKLIDVTDTYHLWVFDKDFDMPFGIHPTEYIKATKRKEVPLSEKDLLLLKSKFDKNAKG